MQYTYLYKHFKECLFRLHSLKKDVTTADKSKKNFVKIFFDDACLGFVYKSLKPIRFKEIDRSLKSANQ